jgi:hypothetical protein
MAPSIGIMELLCLAPVLLVTLFVPAATLVYLLVPGGWNRLKTALPGVYHQ